MNRREQPEPSNQATRGASSSEPAVRSSVVGPRSEPERFDHRSSKRLPPSVDLHIEELVLNGFEPAHRYAIGEAIERELTRLFSEQGAPSAMAENVEIDLLNAGSINVQPGANARTTGVQLARAIYGGIKR